MTLIAALASFASAQDSAKGEEKGALAPTEETRKSMSNSASKAGSIANTETSSAAPGTKLFEKVRADAASGFEEYRLRSNGLRVLLVERHATPIVTATMVFHVGSRNEAVGYTGATHFLEHMMFKGTNRFDPLKKSGLDDVLKAVGGVNNATTWYDRTNYFEIVPAGELDLCIELEADRMRNLLLRQSDRDAEMTVVRNELERGEDDPDDLLETNLFATAFREHPYHHPVIGWRSDVEGVPISRLKKFYDDFYWPNNATLILIGDFDTKKTLKLVEDNFAAIPRSPQEFPSVYTVESPQEGERRFVIRRGSESPRAIIGFHVPECVNQDTYALDVAESILGNADKRSSRLYKAVVESGMASNVYAMNYSLKDPGLFVVSAQATMNHTPEQLEKTILAELSKMKTEQVSDEELERAKLSLVKSHTLSATDPLSLSSQLTEALSAADWSWWLEYPSKVKQVTKEEVQRVFKKYYMDDNLTVGYYFPKKEQADEKDAKVSGGETHAYTDSPEAKAAGGDEQAEETDTKPSSTRPTEPSAENVRVRKPVHQINIGRQVEKQVLDNGLTLMVLSLPGTGAVAISGKMLAGDYFGTQDKSQTSFLVAESINKGSSKYTKESLANALESMGCELDFYSSTFLMEFDSEIVKEDMPEFVEIIADVLTKPTFPAKELQLEKKLRESDLREDMSDTGEVTWNHLLSNLYKPNHGFYEKTFQDQVDELAAIKRKDIVDFHRSNYTPGNTVLVFVGDTTMSEVRELCSKNFSGWSGRERNKIALSENDINKIEAGKDVVIPLPDKANVDVRIGRPVPISIHDKRYYAAVLANAALGYDSFATRLAPVRDEHGLTYGISSSFEDPTQSFAPWTIKYSVNPKNLAKARSLVKQIVDDYVKGGITPFELEREKGHLSGVFSVLLKSSKDIASRLSVYEICGIPSTYIDEYPGKIHSVTKADVDNVIRDLFDISNAVTVISGTIDANDKPDEKKPTVDKEK